MTTRAAATDRSAESAPRRRRVGPFVLGLAFIAALAACAAPEREGREGSLADLRQLLEEGAEGPVRAEVVEDGPDTVGPQPPFAPLPVDEDDPPIDMPLASPAPDGALRSASEANPAADPSAAVALESSDPLSAFSQNPYLRFGSRILVRRDGRITKPYPLQVGRGRRLLQLMAQIGGFPLTYQIVTKADDPIAPTPEPPAGTVAQIVLLEGWDFEQYSNFQPALLAAPADSKPLDIADWFVVTAGEDLLAEVEQFIDLFVASVPQIEIEARIVEVVTTDELDYGVRGGGTSGAVTTTFPDGTLVDFFSYAVPNSADANEALLGIGTIQDGVAIDAVLEAIQTWENVTITTRPKIAVREGGVAEVINSSEVPFFNFTGFNSSTGNFNAQLTFKQVGVQLYASPRVLGTDTLALNLYIEASEQVGTAISFFDADGNEVRSPLIARRQARTVVYLEPGQAVVIGGLETVREVNQERKVPILGDIPLLGILFRSERKRKERTNVLFFIRPRILQGTDFMSEL
jgi:type II secretory pathway component GspD/PulD (secretin)